MIINTSVLKNNQSEYYNPLASIDVEGTFAFMENDDINFSRSDLIFYGIFENGEKFQLLEEPKYNILISSSTIKVDFTFTYGEKEFIINKQLNTKT